MIEGFARSRQWLCFFLIFCAHIFFFQIYPNFISTNELSRLLLISAVWDDHMLQIDRAMERYGTTQDRAHFNGHFYTDKAIGTSLIGLPVYGVVKLLSLAFNATLTARQLLFLLHVFCVTLPALLFLRPLTRFWVDLDPDRTVLYPLLFVYLFGTIAFTYSMQFISHHLIGICLFLSFYYIYRTKGEGARRSGLIWSGIFSGLALILDYPSIFPVAVIFVYLLLTIKSRDVVWYVLGSLPFCLMIPAYNFAIFGTPFDVTYRHMTAAEHVAQHAQGFIGFRFPRWDAFTGLLFHSAHGLFFFSPILLLAFPGFYFFFRDARWRKEALLFLAIILSNVVFYSGMSNWNGGWAFGPRYLTPVIPFLISVVVYFLSREQIRKLAAVRFSAILLGVLSVIFVTIGTITFPFPPQEMKNPFFVLLQPLFLRGAYAMNLGSILHISPYTAVILFFTLLTLIFLALIVSEKDSALFAHRSLFQGTMALLLALILLGIGYWSIKPVSAFDYYARGSIFFYLGKYSDSVSELRTALLYNPDAHLNRLIQMRLVELSMLSGVSRSPAGSITSSNQRLP